MSHTTASPWPLSGFNNVEPQDLFFHLLFRKPPEHDLQMVDDEIHQ